MYRVLKKVSTREEAYIIKGKLELEGVISIIEADDIGGVNPALNSVQGVRILVLTKDIERAKKILEES
jgi:hypothetical protein